MNHSNTLDINLDPGNDSQALSSLERIRQRLVDTSARNRLVHCRLDRKQVVRLVDELPDQVYERLSDGKPFDMSPVPAPSHQELLDEGYLVHDEITGECIRNSYPNPDVWARRHQINTDYDLPSGTSDIINLGHADDKLQTLLFPEELDTRLDKLRQLSATAMEESGSNVLYLALGFLEWYESPASRTPRLSPLFVVPVDLSRGRQVSTNGLRTHRIRLRDDGLLDNVSLSQRMLQDFGLTMPTLEDDSQPEYYFKAVRKIIEHVDPRWKVRRYAALCLLDFTKQLMYEDLDPARWPADSKLSDHPLLQQCLADDDGVQDGDTMTSLPEYLIDSLPELHSEFPLIHDADSSQHSALIDVVKGRNLVIEGPPGTGKSQTITNLIAACINKGLSVLFVAEKLAALEVVKRRLDQADLGDFCLEVHSHKSNKLSILNSLIDSHKRRENVTSPTALQERINRYEGHKNTLHEHAEKLNQPWRNTELTPHQVLQRATDFAERAPSITAQNVVRVDDPASITASFITETLESAERLQSVFEAVARQTPESSIDTHPWFGVSNPELAGRQRQALIEALERWTERQEHIMKRWNVLLDALHIDSAEAPDQDTLATLLSALDQLPDDIPEKLLQRWDELRDNADSLDALQEQREALRQRFTQLSSTFNPEGLLSVERATLTAQSLLIIRDELGLSGSAALDKAAAHIDQLGSLRTRIATLHDDIRSLDGELPAAFDDIFEPSLNGLIALRDLTEACSELPAKLWRFRDDRYRNPGFHAALDDIEPRILILREQYSRLETHFTVDQLPDSRALEDIHRKLANGGFFGFLKSSYRQARKSLKQSLRPGITPTSAISQLSQLVDFQQGMEELDDVQQSHPALGSAYHSLDTNLSLHRTLLQWYQSIDARFAQHALRPSQKADAIFSLNDQTASMLGRTALSELGERADKLHQSFGRLQDIYPQYFSTFSNDSHLLDPAHGLTGLVSRLDACLAQLGHCVLDFSLPLSELIERASRWSDGTREHLDWTESDAHTRFVPSLFAISADPQTDDSRAQSTLTNANRLARLAATSSLFSSAMQQEPTLAQLGRLRDAHPVLMEELTAAMSARESFETLGQVDRARWQSGSVQLAQCHQHNTRALRQTDWLDTWLSYQRVRQRTALNTLTPLMDHLENGSLPADQTQVAIQADLYQQLAMHMLQVDDELATLDGNEIEAIRQQFQRHDKELLGLQRQQIAANCCRRNVPVGNSRGAVGTYTELSLIQHEASKKNRHVAIRSLLKRAPEAIQALKPCFMMSPMSVAQYLEPGQYDFDVIVMDEASQIRPEEALGAIARARQLVVVGDPKQLPPTSFFSRMASDDDLDDDEEVGLERAESILDAVLPILPTRRLRWHYRSRHESLIAFSNQKFYDADLMLFPSPFNQSDEYGIHFTRLDEGTFNDHVNLIEAAHIVTLLAEQIQERPHESVGVVSMNIHQRDQIEAQWEKHLASDYLLQRACERNQEADEPLFFKNLENVQGDERDVIIISMTYGPQMIGGITYQRFGPISSDTGWRRLNVLLTRSRKRMEIVASMGSGDIRADSSSKPGLQSLRALLEYCETGNLPSTLVTDKAPDSAFEIAVIRKLAAAGFVAEPQLGVAGFFIDLAVRNPDRPDEFLMGIECDGATYHSAKSARDRDRLRQEVLEGLGWKMRRIWSTDWFRNADAQLQAVVAELEQLRALNFR